jgi:hypothetical protein
LSAPAIGLRLGWAAAVMTLCIGGTAWAQTQTTRCDIVVQSQAGGMLEVISAAQLTQPPQVIWRPTPSNGRLELLVSFEQATLESLGEPSGVLIRFPLAADDLPEGIALNIQGQNGRQWRFKGQVRDPQGDSGYVSFGQDLVYGRALLGAIADGQGLTISAERYDRVVASTTFGLANLRARDALLVQARRRFEAADPAMCTRR